MKPFVCAFDFTFSLPRRRLGRQAGNTRTHLWSNCRVLYSRVTQPDPRWPPFLRYSAVRVFLPPRRRSLCSSPPGSEGRVNTGEAGDRCTPGGEAPLCVTHSITTSPPARVRKGQRREWMGNEGKSVKGKGSRGRKERGKVLRKDRKARGSVVSLE